MDKRVVKKKNEICVFAKFSPRILHQKRVRFYASDARNSILELYPQFEKISIDDGCSSLTISNYSEPFEGVWKFFIEPSEIDEEMKKLADENFSQQKKKKKADKEEIVPESKEE